MHAWSKRRVKIVCTLGPASQSRKVIAGLIQAGMDVARLNFSHGTHESHAEVFRALREEAKRLGKNLAILQDLQGPKLRVGKLSDAGVELRTGDLVLLFPEGATKFRSDTEGKTLLPIDAEIAKPIARDVKVGAKILFDDGKVSTQVKEVNGHEILVEVLEGGLLTSRKGMNLPGTPLSMPCCTTKDWEDLKFGLQMGVDAVALSFVRSPKDIEIVREYIRKHSKNPPLLFAKIEREEAVDCHPQIVEVSDGILVARGDMATELGVERVPVIQKQLIRVCNELGVPVITATQMLESMIHSPTPTRAEASDIANAVFDGTDAVMLSAESASGKYPLLAVKTMAKIIEGAENDYDRFSVKEQLLPIKGSVVESIEFSAARVASHVEAKAVVCLTHSGLAAKTVAKFRPSTPIIAIMDRDEAIRKLAFSWGVNGVLIPEIVATDDLFAMVEQVLVKHGIAKKGDFVVVTAGVPTLKKGTTNMIKAHQIGAPTARRL